MRPFLRFPASRGALLALLLAPLCAGEAAAQEESGALIISVTARATGQPLEGAHVVVVGTGITAVTNTAGVLRLAGVPLGVQTVEVRRLGYATRLRMVPLEAGAASTAVFALEVDPVRMAEIHVTAKKKRPVWNYLDRAGFTRRKASGNGIFITRTDIQQSGPRFLSDLLRRYPGVAIQSYGSRGDGYATMSRGGPRRCPIQYYVDGVLIGAGFNVDEVSANDVEGLEVYRGASQVPPEFNRRTASCGVIVIWTRNK